MTATTHKIIAERTGEGWSAEYEITYTYTPAGPLRFYKRNGDPADPPDPESIDYVSVATARWTSDVPALAQRSIEEWAQDWLAAHQDEARAGAIDDITAAMDDAADYERIEREAFIR